MSARTASRTIGWANSRRLVGLKMSSATNSSAAAATASSGSSVIAAASATLVPSPSTATARRSEPAAADAPERRRSTASVTAAGAMRWTRTASPEPVGSCRSTASRSRASRKNGLPPVASWQAAAKSGSTFAPSTRAQSVAVASTLNGAGRSTVASGLAARRVNSVDLAPLRVDAKTATRRPSRRGREVIEEAQRLRVGPVQVVDGEGDRRAVGEVVQEPVQAVQHREGAISESRRQLDARGAEERLGERRRTLEQAVGSGPAVTLATTGSSNCRTQP